MGLLGDLLEPTITRSVIAAGLVVSIQESRNLSNGAKGDAS